MSFANWISNASGEIKTQNVPGPTIYVNVSPNMSLNLSIMANFGACVSIKRSRGGTIHFKALRAHTRVNFISLAQRRLNLELRYQMGKKAIRFKK
jgi:hypothetical protein